MRQPVLRHVLKAVDDLCFVSPSAILSEHRSWDLAQARHVAAFVLHRHLGVSLTSVGRMLGGRHHTTILNSVRRVEMDLALMALAHNVARAVDIEMGRRVAA